MLKWLLTWCGNKNGKVNDVVLTNLYEGDRGIADLYDNNEVLRLWLPEPLRMALSQSSKALDYGESQYLREFLVVYLYGSHELLRMHAYKTGLYYEPPPPPPSPDSEDKILYSRAHMVEVIPGLGKNLVACKLRLPAKLKDDLQELADQRQAPLGRFVREILVQHFLGHTIWPDKGTFSPNDKVIADEWENGGNVGVKIRYEDADKNKGNLVEDFY